MNFGKILALAVSVGVALGSFTTTSSALADTSSSAAEASTSSTTSVKKIAAKKSAAKKPLARTAKKSSLKKSAKASAKNNVKAAGLAASGTKNPKSKLGTDFDFQGLAVGGKYNSADGILTTVEGDKSLDNLLSPRPNFKDRLSVAAESQ